MKCAISRPDWRAALLLAACLPVAGAAAAGTLCLVPGAFDDLGKGGSTPEAWAAQEQRNAAATPATAVRYVRVDAMAPAKVTSSSSGTIAGIPLAGRHRIVVAKRSDMREPVAQIRFSFAERKANALCLWYEPYYGSWRLQAGRSCHCRLERPVT